MPDWLSITLLLTFSVAGLCGNLFLLPGNWIMVASAATYAALSNSDRGPTWLIVAVCAGLAVTGELLELILGSAKAAKKGASRRAMILSLVFSIAGSIVGTFIIPIPVIGTVIGAIAGAALGAFGGAWLGEAWIGSDNTKRLEVGQAAMSGRLLGMLAKAAIGTAILAVQIVSLF